MRQFLPHETRIPREAGTHFEIDRPDTARQQTQKAREPCSRAFPYQLRVTMQVPPWA
mgnify:CR=1 FL=1